MRNPPHHALTRATVTLAALLAGAAQAQPAAPADPAVDAVSLAGPPPAAGDTYTQSDTFRLADGMMRLSFGGDTIEGENTMDGRTTTVVVINAVDDDGNVTEVQHTIREDIHSSSSNLGGQEESEEDVEGNLVGRTIVFARTDDGDWARELVGRRANADQLDEMERMDGYEPDTMLYPTEAVPVGHRWKVRGDDLRVMIDDTATNIQGSAAFEFVGLRETEDGPVAELEFSMDATADIRLEANVEASVHMVVSGTIDRDFTRGLDAAIDMSGTFELTMVEEAQQMELQITGTIESTGAETPGK